MIIVCIERLLRLSVASLLIGISPDFHPALTEKIELIFTKIQAFNAKRLGFISQIVTQRAYLNPQMVTSDLFLIPNSSPFPFVSHEEWTDYINECKRMSSSLYDSTSISHLASSISLDDPYWTPLKVRKCPNLAVENERLRAAVVTNAIE